MAATLACAFATHAPATADENLIDEQRAAFREVYPQAERGEWQPVADKKQLLQDYVLWPDLRAAWLTAHLETADEDEIRGYIERYAALEPARDLRYRFALALAEDRPADYLEIYRRHYAGLGSARLDCLAAHADILAGRTDEIADVASGLWLVGYSQVGECDPVFEYMRGAGMLDGTLRTARFDLAIAAEQYSLARYLARSIDDAYLERANRWIDARDHPEEFLQGDDAAIDGPEYRKQLILAIERAAWRDANEAHQTWRGIRTLHPFTHEQLARVARHIALAAARQRQDNAVRFMDALPADAVDVEVLRWQARVALREHRWQSVIAAIERMPADERQEQSWQYWLAVSLRHSGRDDEAQPVFERVAANRSYFGFLAADAIGADYAFAHSATLEDETLLRELAMNPSLIRARELYFVGLESQGRSEWNDAVSELDSAGKAQAAVLANRWNWDSRAIATIAMIGQYDDLEMRYPLPYREQFEDYSATANIPGSWAYGVARNESLFMADIRSHAGAIGLMQLMPATGRKTAAEIDLPYSGLATLTDPDSNIRLGTAYLGKMLQRFGDNRVLATAAYNAGPFKVEEWLPQSATLDARIWIENIPYSETRKFVRRVLASDTIFHWRLTGETRRLSAALRAVDPAKPPEQLSQIPKKTAPGG